VTLIIGVNMAWVLLFYTTHFACPPFTKVFFSFFQWSTFRFWLGVCSGRCRMGPIF